MREVVILGIGQTPVAEHWDRSLKELAGEANKKTAEKIKKLLKRQI